MKTTIDIVTGFLDAGKTTFINKLLREKLGRYKKILVLQCELGEEEIQGGISDCITVISGGIKKEYESEDYGELLRKYAPDYMIIECNGMQRVSRTISQLAGSWLRKSIDIDKVYEIIDASTFKLYLKNFGELIIDGIAAGTDIIVNRSGSLHGNGTEELLRDLVTFNPEARIFECKSSSCELIKLDTAAYLKEQRAGSNKKSTDKLLSIALVFIIGYILVYMRFVSMDAATFQVFVTVFLSILVQATPFILLGVIVSSAIQILISEQTIARLFPRNGFVGMLIGVVLGAAFPVCDCAVVPVASRLIRKGVPVPAAITFMFASPIVNPVVIAATYYAFPNDHRVVFFRVFLGILISMLVASVFMLLPGNNSRIVSDRIKDAYCSCGFCSPDTNTGGFFNKLSLIFMHSGIEFVQTMKYLIIGAFLSSLAQFAISQETLASFGQSKSLLPLLVMMLAAFVLSICSTSDAFIARTFTGRFAMVPILGFLVLGPMIDIKNLMMLFGNFRKGFVIKLVLCLFTISFIVLGLLNKFLI